DDPPHGCGRDLLRAPARPAARARGRGGDRAAPLRGRSPGRLAGHGQLREAHAADRGRHGPGAQMSAALLVRGAVVEVAGKVVLDDVSLEAARGEFVCLVGPNGGGKTTLLKAVLGLLPMRAGTIEVLGLPPGKRHRSVGYLPQSKAFAPSFPATVAE